MLSSSDPNAHATLLTFYTDLLRFWSIQFNPKNRNREGGSTQQEVQQAFTALATHATYLSSASIASNNTSSPTSTILSLYEMLADAALTSSSTNKRHLVPLILPPATVVYELALSSSLADHARLCALLATCKRAFELGTKAGFRHPQSVAGHINTFVMDLCNLLWRGKAFAPPSVAATATAAGFLAPQSVLPSLGSYLTDLEPDYALATAFDLSHNPLLASIAAAVLSELELEVGASDSQGARHAGPATVRSLTMLSRDGGADIPWKTYRVRVLEWLEERGVAGVKTLMFATMKELINTTA